MFRRTPYLLALLALTMTACNKPQHTDETPAEQTVNVKPPSGRSVKIDRITLGNGLVIEDLVTGTGDLCLPGNTVRVRYTCRLADGAHVDSTGAEPADLRLPEMIRGWQDGLPGMRVGGKRRLTIPPELGYGSRGAGGVIKGGETLVFVVDLLGVR